MYGRKVTVWVDEFSLPLMVNALGIEAERLRKLQLVARDIMDRDGWALRRIERRTIAFTVSSIGATLTSLSDDRGYMAAQVRADVLLNRNSIPRSKANEERHAEMVAAWKRQG